MPDEQCVEKLVQREFDRQNHDLIKELMRQLGDVHETLHGMQTNLDNRLSDLEGELSNHMRDEGASVAKMLNEFRSYKDKTSAELIKFNQLIEEKINPLWDRVKKEEIIWNFTTEKVPKYASALYKLILGAISISVVIWGIVEYFTNKGLHEFFK